MAVVTYGIAHLEFSWALWTRTVEQPPWMVTILQAAYEAVWFLPASTLLTGLRLLARRPISPQYIAWWSSAFVCLHVLWLLFFWTCMYLANQTFLCGD
ncbi:MAG: hypothetical protein D6766_12585 [Verrucomicrobia bacterium]|nr:MAG: hypothetical protein D6766_12585 [Verrucomicrobiota bacterium]